MAHHLAQLNIARLRAPLDSPQLADFVNNLERINSLADNAPGFVWRLQTEDGDATGIDYFGADVIVNLSVWRDVDSLKNFVYKSAHIEVLRRRREWFETTDVAYTVLWWIPAGNIPTVADADEKLQHLRSNGAGKSAFTFKQTFPPPDGG